MSVLVFCDFSVSEKLVGKYSRNWTKINVHQYFTDTSTESKGEMERRQRTATPPHGVVGGAVRPHGVGATWLPSVSPLDSVFVMEK